jgi:hypothetical protein
MRSVKQTRQPMQLGPFSPAVIAEGFFGFLFLYGSIWIASVIGRLVGGQ